MAPALRVENPIERLDVAAYKVTTTERSPTARSSGTSPSGIRLDSP
jgi:hypothetical protein